MMAQEIERPSTSAALAHARFYLLVFLAFSLPLVFYPLNTSYLYTKTIYALFMISSLLILSVAEIAVKGRVQFVVPPLTLPLIAVIAAAALSLTMSSNLALSLSSLIPLVYFIALYVLVVNAVRTPQEAKTIVGSLLFSGSLVALYGLLQHFEVLEGPPGEHGPQAMISTLGNKNFVAAFLACLIPPGIALFMHTTGWTRALIGLTLAMALGTLLLARSELAWFSLAIALAFFGLFALARRRGWRIRGSALMWTLLIVLLLLPALVLTGLALRPDPDLASPLGTETGRSLRLRLFNWRVAWEIFLDHPWLGAGLGHFKLLFLDYKAELMQTDWGRSFDFTLSRSLQAHNEYAQTAAEMGVLGLIALAWTLGALVKTVQEALSPSAGDHGHLYALKLGLCAGVVALLTDAAFNFPLHRPASALALVLFLGLLHSRALATENQEGQGEAPLGRRPQEIALGLGRRGIAVLTVAVVLATASVCVASYRDFRADLYLEAGRLDLEAGRVSHARAKLEQSLRWAFEPSEALFYVGRVFYEQGETERAIEAWERSLRGRVAEGTYLLLARAYLERGKDQRAWDYLQRLLATEPHPLQKIPGYYLRAELYRRQGDLELALAQLERVIQQRPDYVAAYVLMARVHRERGELERARALYHEALEVASRALEEKRRLFRTRLSGPGLTGAEWGRLSREIEELESQMETIREALAELEGEAP